MIDFQIALIVSSDEEIRERFSRLINQIGATCIIEKDKEKALNRLLEVDVRLAIVDMDDDDRENLDFLSVMKKLRPKVPIIAITDDSTEKLRNQLFNQGVYCCFIKPLAKKDTEEMIGKVGEELST